MVLVTIDTYRDWRMSLRKWDSDTVNSSTFTDKIDIDQSQLDGIMECNRTEIQERIYNLIYWKFKTPKKD
jgi:hypothetical protein